MSRSRTMLPGSAKWVAAGLAAGVAASPALALREPSPIARYVGRSATLPVPVYIYGERLNTDAIMLKRVGRTLLPMRALFTSLGGQVVWNERERAVYAWKTDGTGVRFGLGERTAQSLLMPTPGAPATVVETRPLDAPAQLIGGRVYIPVRAAGELLGTEVTWNDDGPAVHIEPVIAAVSSPAH